jgi:hypothetical protein
MLCMLHVLLHLVFNAYKNHFKESEKKYILNKEHIFIIIF